MSKKNEFKWNDENGISYCDITGENPASMVAFDDGSVQMVFLNSQKPVFLRVSTKTAKKLRTLEYAKKRAENAYKKLTTPKPELPKPVPVVEKLVETKDAFGRIWKRHESFLRHFYKDETFECSNFSDFSSIVRDLSIGHDTVTGRRNNSLEEAQKEVDSLIRKRQVLVGGVVWSAWLKSGPSAWVGRLRGYEMKIYEDFSVQVFPPGRITYIAKPRQPNFVEAALLAVRKVEEDEREQSLKEVSVSWQETFNYYLTTVLGIDIYVYRPTGSIRIERRTETPFTKWFPSPLNYSLHERKKEGVIEALREYMQEAMASRDLQEIQKASEKVAAVCKRFE